MTFKEIRVTLNNRSKLRSLIKMLKARAAVATEIPAAAQRFATRIDGGFLL